MVASKRLTLCAIALSAGLLLASTANAGNSGGSHAVSAPQQKSVRQSADVKLPNKPPASRKLQKRDATAVKTPANKQLLGDYREAKKPKKGNYVIERGSDIDYLKSAIGAQGKTKNTKQEDDLEKQKQEKAKELQDLRDQKAKEEGLEARDPNAPQQSSSPNPFSDPIGYVEKQIQDGTTSHGSQPNRSDNFVQDANDFAKGASQYGEPTKGGSGSGFGETAKDVMNKATNDNTPARLRQCANC
jgi:hypothetical protein